MKVLVTGGSGFIGSHVIDRLSAHGHEPRNFDLVLSPYHDGDLEQVTGDLLDLEAVRSALRGCDAAVHLAAVADVNDVVADPARAELVNDRGTGVLLEAARAEGIARVLYASTVWVYGNANGVGPVDEDSHLPLPGHLYTATKLAGEMYCTSYGALWGLEHTILRFGIPYGPRARPATVVAAFVARAPAAAGRIYNLVGDESVSVREIAETVRELVADVPIVHAPDRPGDLRPAEISGARAAQELGWRARTPFADGVRRYVDWVTATQGTPSAATASRIEGKAPAVPRQES